MSSWPTSSLSGDSALYRIVADYWEAVERGESPDQSEWLARYPEFHDELSDFFADWSRMHQLVGTCHSAVPEQESEESSSPPDHLPDSSSPFPRSVRNPAAPGAMFGGYELLAELGRGGMGVVYKARQQHPQRTVALKRLRSGHAFSAADSQRFREEAAAVARLDHPHIVPVFEVGEHEGTYYYTMKLLEGGNLGSRLSQFFKAPSEAARLLVSVARAVHHAHCRGILHRDLKPSNILLDETGHAYVADFGLARQLEATEELTRTGDLIGTPPYMAPEQTCGGRRQATAATDVYGLGAVLYALLTGSPPASGDTVWETLRQIQERDPPTPRRLNRNVPADLETICLKALKKAPRQRYASAEAFADDLQRYLDGRPIMARRTGHPERTWLWMRRKPMTAALLATLAAAAVLLIVGLGVHSARLQELNSQLDTLLGDSRQAHQEALAAQHRIQQSEAEAGRLLYASDMTLAAQAGRAGDSRQARELLERHLPASGAEDLRGFEWHYLWKGGQVDEREVAAHDQPLYCVRYAGDGQALMAAGEDATIRAYDAQSGRPRWALPTDQAEINSVELTPDGRWLASAGDDGSVRVWETESQRQRLTIAAHPGQAYQAVFVPTLQWIVSCGDDPVIRIWDLPSGKPVGALRGHTDAVEAIALSPDGTRLASASSDWTARIWDLESQTVVRTLSGHTSRLTAVAFSPDGRWLATAALDKTVRIWSMASGETVFLTSELDGIQCLDFSPRGDELVVGDRGGSLHLWRMAGEAWSEEAERVRSWRAHRGRIYSVAFSPLHGWLASAGQDGRLVVCERSTRPLRQVIERPDAFADAVWIPQHDRLAVAEPEGVCLYDPQTCHTVQTLAMSVACAAVAATADGQRVAASDGQGRVRLWDWPVEATALPRWENDEAVRRSPSGARFGASSLAFSPDGALLTHAAFDGRTLFFLEAASGRLLAELPITNCWGPTFSPDGRRLAVVSVDVVQIWDVAQRRRLHELAGHTNTINAIAYSRDGRLLATASNDRSVKLWDAATGRELLTFAGHRGEVEGVAFSPDGRSLVSAGSEGAIRLWHLATGRPLHQFDTVEQPLRRIFFSPDGAHLVAIAGAPYSTLLLYDTRPAVE